MVGESTTMESFTIETHPILSLLGGMDEGSISKKHLNQFIEFLEASQQAASFQPANYKTITSFMKKYIEYQIFNNPNVPIHKQFPTLNKKLSMPDDKRKIFLKSLSRIAFMNLICGIDIKWDHLKEEFYLETSPIFSEFDWSEKYNPMRILKQLEGTQGRLWVFRERFVQEFLAACYQADKILEALTARKYHLIGRKLTQSLKMMPGTSDIWCMTFGLTSRHCDLCPHQLRLMTEVVGQLRQILKKFVSSKMEKSCNKSGVRYRYSEMKKNIKEQANNRLTRFFIECTYESSNKGQLIRLMDQILTNETINYSDICLSQNRVLYSLAAIGYFMTVAPRVYGLHLPKNRIDQKNIKMLTEPLHSVSDNTLQVLNLSENDIGQRGMESLFRFFVKASDLTHLDVSNCHVTDRGLVMFVQAFICMPLIFINLSRNFIGSRGIDHLSRNLCYLPSLEWLDLSDNCINEGAVTLARAMSSLSSLRYLNLDRNNLDDRGVTAVAQVIGSLEKIQYVSFAENSITAAGSDALADQVKRSHSIRSLDVRLNKIPFSAVMKLKRAAKSQGRVQVVTWEQHPYSIPLDSPSTITERDVNEPPLSFQGAQTLPNKFVYSKGDAKRDSTDYPYQYPNPSYGNVSSTLEIKDPDKLEPTMIVTRNPTDEILGRVDFQLSIALKKAVTGDSAIKDRLMALGRASRSRALVRPHAADDDQADDKKEVVVHDKKDVSADGKKVVSSDGKEKDGARDKDDGDRHGDGKDKKEHKEDNEQGGDYEQATTSKATTATTTTLLPTSEGLMVITDRLDNGKSNDVGDKDCVEAAAGIDAPDDVLLLEEANPVDKLSEVNLINIPKPAPRRRKWKNYMSSLSYLSKQQQQQQRQDAPAETTTTAATTSETASINSVKTTFNRQQRYQQECHYNHHHQQRQQQLYQQQQSHQHQQSHQQQQSHQLQQKRNRYEQHQPQLRNSRISASQSKTPPSQESKTTSCSRSTGRLNGSSSLQNDALSFLDNVNVDEEADNNVEKEKNEILNNISRSKKTSMFRKSWSNVSSYSNPSNSFNLVDSIHLYDL